MHQLHVFSPQKYFRNFFLIIFSSLSSKRSLLRRGSFSKEFSVLLAREMNEDSFKAKQSKNKEFEWACCSSQNATNKVCKNVSPEKLLRDKILCTWGAAKAQWIRLHLPSYRPGFESQAYHLSFYKFITVSCGKDENKTKKGRDWPIF